MEPKEIDQFIKTLHSWCEHAAVEELNYLRRESLRLYNKRYHEYKAKEIGVQLDYYMKEFVI